MRIELSKGRPNGAVAMDSFWLSDATYIAYSIERDGFGGSSARDAPIPGNEPKLITVAPHGTGNTSRSGCSCNRLVVSWQDRDIHSPPPSLVLIGPAAVGKSTIGNLTAGILGIPFVDLDEVGADYYSEVDWSVERLVRRIDKVGRVAAEREWEPARPCRE